MVIDRIGYGLGGRRGHAIPNAVRAILGHQTPPTATPPGPETQVTVIEVNLDDMSPQLLPPLMELLLQNGALDVGVLPILMKKGRPGQQLQVMCAEVDRPALISLILRESTSIGVRFYRAERVCLERQIKEVETRFGPVRVKLSGQGGAVWNVMPEFEDCRRVAESARVPLKQVQQEAMRLAMEMVGK